MGSWSVYCSISNIAITAGQQCVLLPLKKNERGDNYLPYLPATLPIFGEYDDYGGLENIEKDENAKLIESHFGVSIEDFAHMFTRGIINNHDTRHISALIADNDKDDEIKDWSFMFIDRQVYDFMSSHVGDTYGGKGNLDFGSEGILKLLGFEYVGENTNNPTYDPKRYKYEWKYGHKKFYSDGTWLHHGENDAIYNFTGEYSSLEKHITIPEDKKWIADKAMWQLWRHLDSRKQGEHLFWVVGMDRTTWSMKSMTRRIYGDEDAPKEEPKNLYEKYIDNLETFGDGLAELVTVRFNLHPMSGTFAPYIPYTTPQCGEIREHQTILEKFAEINKSYLSNED